MVTDALVAADDVFKIKEAIDDPKEYIKLSDNILSKIEYSKKHVCVNSFPPHFSIKF